MARKGRIVFHQSRGWRWGAYSLTAITVLALSAGSGLLPLLLRWASGSAPLLYGIPREVLAPTLDLISNSSLVNPLLAYRLWAFWWSLLRYFALVLCLLGSLAPSVGLALLVYRAHRATI